MSDYRAPNPFDQLTPGVRGLIIANVALFLAFMLLPAWLVEIFGLTPILVLTKVWLWQLLTYSFLHGSGWHLFFNMFALWMFGPHIERAWGTKRFLFYYGLCAFGAAATQFFVAPFQLVIGASGAIYGVLLAFGFLFPDTVIYLFFLFPFRAIQAVVIIALFTFVAAMGSGGARIAHFAHLGGMLTGFIYLRFPVWRDRFNMWRLERRFYYSRGHRPTKRLHSEDDSLRDEVDRILEKISSQGIQSLTDDEHKTMQRYAHRKR